MAGLVVSSSQGLGSWLRSKPPQKRGLIDGFVWVERRKDPDMPNPKSFSAWLKTHKSQDNAIGDLARDVSDDPDWPARKGRQGQLDYLEGRGAIPAAIETLERAWTEYEAYRTAQGDT